jgi:hypothetical protein
MSLIAIATKTHSAPHVTPFPLPGAHEEIAIDLTGRFNQRTKKAKTKQNQIMLAKRFVAGASRIVHAAAAARIGDPPLGISAAPAARQQTNMQRPSAIACWQQRCWMTLNARLQAVFCLENHILRCQYLAVMRFAA